MCQHHNHSLLALVPMSRKMGWALLEVGCILRAGILPLVASTTPLVTPRVSLVVVLVTLVTVVTVVTFVTLVLIASV